MKRQKTGVGTPFCLFFLFTVSEPHFGARRPGAVVACSHSSSKQGSIVEEGKSERRDSGQKPVHGAALGQKVVEQVVFGKRFDLMVCALQERGGRRQSAEGGTHLELCALASGVQSGVPVFSVCPACPARLSPTCKGKSKQETSVSLFPVPART